jgi:hypothetical protein
MRRFSPAPLTGALVVGLAAMLSFPGPSRAVGPLVALQQVPTDLCAPNSGTAVLTGTITGPGAVALANLTVTAYTLYGQQVGSDLTDASGVYRIEGLVGTNYLLRFGTPFDSFGLVPEWYSNQSSGISGTPILVNTASTVTINATLDPGAQLRGRISGEGDAPLQSVSVSVYDGAGDQVARATSDASGVYTTTPGLAPGSYRLLFDPPGNLTYLPEYYGDKPTLAAADPVTVTALGLVDNLDASLARGAQLAGRVTSAVDGAGLPGISVSVSGEGGSDFKSTDANGFYTTTAGLANGVYQVSFRPGFASQNIIQATRSVTVTTPTLIPGVDAALSPGGTLIGRVTDSEGQPIQAVSIRVSTPDNRIQKSTNPDASGVYTTTGLPSEVYRVSYQSNRYIFEYYDDKPRDAFSSFDPITVTAPLTVTGIDAVLARGAVVTGTVTDTVSGAPIEDVFVEVLDDNGGRVESAFTDAAGVYTTSSTLASGSYFVRFNPDSRFASCAYITEYYNDQLASSAATPISVTAPLTTTNINAAMSLGSIILGSVTDAASGAPLSDVQVSVIDSDDRTVAFGRTSFRGGYLTSPALPSGSYTLRFSDGNGGYIDEYYDDTTSRALAATLTLTAPNELPLINAALSVGGSIAGRVRAAGFPDGIPDVSVIVYADDGEEVGFAITADDGSYRVADGLATGDYRVEFRPRNVSRQELGSDSVVRVAQGGEPDGDEANYLRLFYPNALTLAEATPIRVTAPGETINIDATLPLGTYLPLVGRGS